MRVRARRAAALQEALGAPGGWYARAPAGCAGRPASPPPRPPPLRDRLQQLRLPVLLGLLFVCACGCGGNGAARERSAGASGAGAQQLLHATFAAHAPIARARVALTLALSPGSPAASAGAAQALSLRLSGPFEVASPGSAALFELALELRHGAGRPLRLGLDASRRRLAIEIDGRRLGGSAAALAALRRAFGEALLGGGVASGAQAWVVRPRLEGSQRLDGVLTERLRGALDPQGFDGAARRLLGLVGGLAGLLGAPVPAKVLAAGAGAGGSVSLYSGARDHILRRLELIVPLTARAGRGGAPRPTRSASFFASTK